MDKGQNPFSDIRTQQEQNQSIVVNEMAVALANELKLLLEEFPSGSSVVAVLYKKKTTETKLLINLIKDSGLTYRDYEGKYHWRHFASSAWDGWTEDEAWDFDAPYIFPDELNIGSSKSGRSILFSINLEDFTLIPEDGDLSTDGDFEDKGITLDWNDPWKGQYADDFTGLTCRVLLIWNNR